MAVCEVRIIQPTILNQSTYVHLPRDVGYINKVPAVHKKMHNILPLKHHELVSEV